MVKNPDGSYTSKLPLRHESFFWNTVIPQPNHWSLPVPIALAHLLKCLRAEPSQHIISKLVPKQRLPRTNQGVCDKEPLFLCNRVSEALLQSGLLSRIFWFASGPRPPNIRIRTRGSSQNLLRDKTFKTVSPEKYAGVREITPDLREITPELRRALFWQLSAKH